MVSDVRDVRFVGWCGYDNWNVANEKVVSVPARGFNCFELFITVIYIKASAAVCRIYLRYNCRLSRTMVLGNIQKVERIRLILVPSVLFGREH